MQTSSATNADVTSRTCHARVVASTKDRRGSPAWLHPEKMSSPYAAERPGAKARPSHTSSDAQTIEPCCWMTLLHDMRHNDTVPKKPVIRAGISGVRSDVKYEPQRKLLMKNVIALCKRKRNEVI